MVATGAGLRSRAALLLVIGCAWTAAVAPAPAATSDPVVRHVLLLYPYDTVPPATAVAGEATRRQLMRRFGTGIEIHSDFLDLVRFPGEQHGERTARYLTEKYAGTRLDLVIALNTEALRFATRHRASFAPDVPLIFCCATRAAVEAEIERPPDVTGIVIDYDITRTLQLAERLQPRARKLVFISGNSEIDDRWLAMYRRQLAPLEGRFETAYWTGLSLEEIVARAARLTPDTIVLAGIIFADGSGRQLVPAEAAETIAAQSGAPVYAPVDTFLGRGIVGGYMGTFEAAGTEVADLAAEILRGADPRGIPPRPSLAQQFRVDARQLARWGLSPDDLPDGTVVAFATPSLWQQHRNLVMTTAAVIGVQALLIAALLVQIVRRRRAEASLKSSEARWRSVFDTSTVGIALTDQDLKYVAANGAYRTMTGLDEADLPASSPVDMVGDADREAMRAAHRAVGAGERRSAEAVRRYRRRDGSTIWVHDHVSAIAGDHATPPLFLETAVDITDRKRAEEGMQRAHAELARASRLTTIGEMTASIAHEVNQPLTAIVANGNAGLRWLGAPEPDYHEARAAFRRIVEAGHRAGAVIAAIRAMFAKAAPETSDVDVDALVREVVGLTRIQLDQAGILVVEQFAGRLPPVRGERVQLQQVVLNLVVNAIEAMAETEDRERVLRLSTGMRGKREILVTVQDSGPGIASEDLEKVFEAFFTTKPRGMGLGLSICRSIVEGHGGRLSAARGHPGGAEFQVVLPVGEAGGRDGRPRGGGAVMGDGEAEGP